MSAVLDTVPPPATASAPCSIRMPPVLLPLPVSVRVPSPILLSRPLPSRLEPMPMAWPLLSMKAPLLPMMTPPAPKLRRKSCWLEPARSTPPLKVMVADPAPFSRYPVSRMPRRLPLPERVRLPEPVASIPSKTASADTLPPLRMVRPAMPPWAMPSSPSMTQGLGRVPEPEPPGSYPSTTSWVPSMSSWAATGAVLASASARPAANGDRHGTLAPPARLLCRRTRSDATCTRPSVWLKTRRWMRFMVLPGEMSRQAIGPFIPNCAEQGPIPPSATVESGQGRGVAYNFRVSHRSLGDASAGERDLDKGRLYLRAKAIAVAAEPLRGAEREAFLARECGDDAALRSEVDWLQQALEEPDPTPQGVPDLSGASVEAAAGSGYRLLRQLGRGGMGVVYLAERRLGDGTQLVALKLLDAGGWPEDQAVRRLTSEAHILARLSHPHIAGLLDAGHLSDGRPFLAMQYVQGERIDRWCAARELSLDDRLRLFLKVCGAVEYAHRHLVIHRDLKPANILVDHTGEPKLLDFGIARLLDGSAAPRTQTGHRALTLSYASPEQIRNEPLSTASDVWQLGVVLYELVSGTRPFPGSDSPLTLTHAILGGEPPPPSRAAGRRVRGRLRQLSADIDAIVMKAMRAAPGERYGTVADLAADLRRALQSRPVRARRGQWWYRTRRLLHRHRGAVAAGVVIASLLAAFAVERESQLRLAQQERDKAQALADF